MRMKVRHMFYLELKHSWLSESFTDTKYVFRKQNETFQTNKHITSNSSL